MNTEIFSYRKLLAYQQSKKLVLQIYQLIAKFPKEENYALCDQLRRAVISVPSNIAEGMGRSSHKEQTHFLEIAFGSLTETMCQIEIAKDLKYITESDLKSTENLAYEIGRLLSGLRNRRLKLSKGEQGGKATGE